MRAPRPSRVLFAAALSLLAVFAVVSAANVVNINTATLEELMTLNGIGEVKAQAIIDYRAGPSGPFETIEEIQEVSGIGPSTYDNIKDFITVEGDTQVDEPANEEGTQTGGATSTTSSSTSSSSGSSKKAGALTARIVVKNYVVAGADARFSAEATVGSTPVSPPLLIGILATV